MAGPKSPLSMTGAGTASVAGSFGRVDAEARSVNHRFLKISLHVAPALSSLEPEIEERVRQRLERGHVTVTLRFTRSPKAAAAALKVDVEVAKAAAKRLKALAKACGIEGVVALEDLLAIPGVVTTAGEGETPGAVTKAALKALDGALVGLAAARAREGGALADACRGLLARVTEGVKRVEARAPEVPKAARDRLTQRIGALLEGTGVATDPAAIAREVAAIADRADVTEEVQRLTAHVAHVEALLASGGAIGRRLDFLVQELHREANTIGSKTPDPETTATVIDLKAEVERLREQAQNFE